MTGIYKITNKINDKCYIGQSINIEKRWKEHEYFSNCSSNSVYQYPLYKSIRKYGIKQFEFEVLEECDIDDMPIKEKYYIELYNSIKRGYNQTIETTNPMLDPEIKKRAVENSRNTWQNETVRQKQSERSKKMWESKEYRDKMYKNNFNNDELNKKRSELMFNRPKKMFEEISKFNTEYCNKPEIKQKKSDEIKKAWQRGCYDILREKGKKKKWHERIKNDPEYREQVIQNMKAGHKNKKPIIMLDLITKEKLMEFESLVKAAEWIKENTKYKKPDTSSIAKCARKSIKHKAYGYSWVMKEDKKNE